MSVFTVLEFLFVCFFREGSVDFYFLEFVGRLFFDSFWGEYFGRGSWFEIGSGVGRAGYLGMGVGV